MALELSVCCRVAAGGRDQGVYVEIQAFLFDSRRFEND